MVLGVIASLAGVIAQAQAQAQQAQIMRENLAFQKQQADREYDLSTAARTDAFGNETSFDDLLKKWIIELAPMQKRLVKAGEREQLLGLTEDAGRQRDLRRSQEGRSREARDVYNDLLADFRYDEPDDEDTIFDRIIGDTAAMRTETGNAAKNAIGGQAARLGRGGDVNKLLQTIVGGVGTSDVAQARSQAFQEAGARKQQHRGLLDELGTFANIWDAVGEAPLRFSDAPGRMDATQQDMLSRIAAAISGGASRVGSAYSRLANTMQAPDFGSLASSLNSLKLGGRGGGSVTTLSGANAPLWAGPVMGGYPYDYDTNLDNDLDYSTF